MKIAKHKLGAAHYFPWLFKKLNPEVKQIKQHALPTKMVRATTKAKVSRFETGKREDTRRDRNATLRAKLEEEDRHAASKKVSKASLNRLATAKKKVEVTTPTNEDDGRGGWMTGNMSTMSRTTSRTTTNVGGPSRTSTRTNTLVQAQDEKRQQGRGGRVSPTSGGEGFSSGSESPTEFSRKNAREAANRALEESNRALAKALEENKAVMNALMSMNQDTKKHKRRMIIEDEEVDDLLLDEDVVGPRKIESDAPLVSKFATAAKKVVKHKRRMIVKEEDEF